MGVLPRVVVDARMLGEHGHGIANYVSDLAFGLAELRGSVKLPYDLIFLVAKKKNVATQLANFPTFETTYPFLHPLENWEIPETLTRLRADLYHSTSFSSLPFCPCPYIQTIHDLNHLTYGSIGKKLYYLFWLRRFANNARKIVTVSEFSRQEIAKWFSLSEGQIAVAENAIRVPMLERIAGPSEALIRAAGLRHGKYFFALSSMKRHKNLAFLVRAYEAYRREAGPNEVWPLVLPVPEGSFRNEGVLCLGAFSNEEAMSFLKHAGAFLFPSLYEGFGRPPLEAVALGVPVIVSEIPPLREGLSGVLEGERLFLSPNNIKAWQEALLKAAHGEMARPGAETKVWISSRYSARGLAEKMDVVYRSTIRKFTG
jgi:glycosyltransferase involved in cell wall biosynthesis